MAELKKEFTGSLQSPQGANFAMSELPAGIEVLPFNLKAEDGAPSKGMLYRKQGTRPKVGVHLMHPRTDQMQNYNILPLAQAGYAVLGRASRWPSYPPSLPILKDMYEYLGDPTNELEQFTDPKSYYEKRGAEYRDGVIIWRAKGDSKPLKANYKGATTGDAGVFYCPQIPDLVVTTEKVEVSANNRRLSATYTQEIPQPLEELTEEDFQETLSYYGEDCEKDLLEELEKEVTAQIIDEINKGAIEGPKSDEDTRREKLLEICDKAIELSRKDDV